MESSAFMTSLQFQRDGLSPATVEHYGYWLEKFREFIAPKPLEDADKTDCRSFINRLRASRSRLDGQPIAHNTIRTIFVALRSQYQWATDDKILTENPWIHCRRMKFHDDNQKRPTAVLDFSAVGEALNRIPVKTLKNRRDRAIAAIAFGGGLRRDEIIHLRTSDLVRTARGRLSIIVRHGKGDKRRQVTVSSESETPIALWLEETMRSSGHGFLFPSRYGAACGKHINANTVYRAVKKYFDAAPHAARATFISFLLANGYPAPDVARAAGHASINMTYRYYRRKIDPDESVGQFCNYAKKVFSGDVERV